MEGLWIARFTAGAARGNGVVLLRSGEVLGGDLRHTYRGSWLEDGPSLNARVSVEPWAPADGVRATGEEQAFTMTLMGTCTDHSASLQGHPDERPDVLITVEMQRAA